MMMMMMMLRKNKGEKATERERSLVNMHEADCVERKERGWIEQEEMGIQHHTTAMMLLHCYFKEINTSCGVIGLLLLQMLFDQILQLLSRKSFFHQHGFKLCNPFK